MDIQDQPLQSAGEIPAPAPITAPAQAATSSSPATSATPATPAAIPVEAHQTASRSHKSLIIGIVLAAIVVVSGLSVFIGFNNSSQYQGFLQKIEAETEKLKNVPGDATEAKIDISDVASEESGATIGQPSAEANPNAALPEFDNAIPGISLKTGAEEEGLTR